MTLSPREVLNFLRRDVALRGGLMAAAATLIALLLLSVIVWLFLIERLETRIEESLIKRHAVSLSNDTIMSDEDRAVVRKFRLGLPVRDEGAYAWMDHDGVTFSGNVSGLECKEGFYDGWLDINLSAVDTPLPLLSESEADAAQHDRFRFIAMPRTQGCLVFGRSMYEVDATSESMKELLVWLVPLCLIPALVVSIVQSLKLRSRLLRLGGVVQALSKGDLAARMPVEGDDDIDRLAGTANHSFDRLQESVSTMQQLSSVMAHDLRAPLNRVSIPLDKALQANRAGQSAVEPLELVKSGLDDARAVFDALLRISQIESGRQRLKFTNIDLFEITEGLFEIYEAVVEDANLTLEFEVTGSGTSIIHGDKDMVRQAVVNLIENAIRYTPEGSHIRICGTRDLHHPTLVIRDNGPGLPDEERPRVLQRLYRYEGSTGGKEGHGLGLSLVKAIVDVHQGVITLEDAKPGLLVRLQFQAAKIS